MAEDAQEPAKDDAPPEGGKGPAPAPADKGSGSKEDGAKKSGDADEKGDGGDKPQAQSETKPKKKTPLWPWIVGGLVVLVFVLLVLWIILAPHPLQRTDDAYVTAHFATVAPRIAGQITDVAVNDNERVRAGQLLVAIDDRDYRTALAQAQANLSSDQARVLEAQAQVTRQPAMIRQAQAQIESNAAHLALSSTDAQRYTNLAASGAGTVQQRQQSDTTRRQDQASLASARAELDAQRKQLGALEAEVAAARGRVAMDAAQLQQAQLNLSYTRITAPIDGVVDQRQVQVGDHVAPGQAVMTVVPLAGIYILANYREFALRHMRPGQHARIHVDTYDIDLNGVVDSLPPATGAAYAPIPPNNATGNFTKIVQRLPVKIVLSPHQRLAELVRVGMSTEVTVDTHLEDVVALQRAHARRVTGWR